MSRKTFGLFFGEKRRDRKLKCLTVTGLNISRTYTKLILVLLAQFNSNNFLLKQDFLYQKILENIVTSAKRTQYL